MTPDQIKQIAEEYAKAQIDRANCISDGEYNSIISRWTFDISLVLKWLDWRYYVVDRHKVSDEYDKARKRHEASSSSNTVLKRYWEGRVDAFKNIFGTENFNKKKRELGDAG